MNISTFLTFNFFFNAKIVIHIFTICRKINIETIIIISSIAGLVGHTTLGAYGISKAADFALVRNIAAEFGPDNVRANAIAPGLVKTDFARALWDNPEYLKAATANAPLRRIGTPEEIAGGVVFLASEAGQFMTGQTLVIDGGRVISNE